MTRIYTRGGDKGTTQVYADKPLRVDKNDVILHCYGELDELNCHLGLLATYCNEMQQTALQNIQRVLFRVGFVISASDTLQPSDVTRLEQQIDALTAHLPPLTRFTLPGGCRAAAQAHVCRAVCRRAERALVALSHHHEVAPTVLQYINRLSDYCFMLARSLNAAEGAEEHAV